MATNSSTSHSDQQPSLRPLWFFIIAVLLIELGLRVLPEGFQTRTMMHRAEGVCYQPPVDIQLMGDSATSALSAAHLEQALGKKYSIGNYSLPGTSPLFSYFLLKRELDAGKKPKLIVLAPNPFTWGDPMLDRFLARFASPSESAEFLADSRNFSGWIYGTAARASYTLRYREELYKAVTGGDTAFFTTWDKPVSPIQNTRSTILTLQAEPQKSTTVRINTRNLPPLLTRPITIHPHNRLYLEKLCALARKNGIQIAWVTLPVPELITQGVDMKTLTASYSTLVAEMCKRFDNLHLLTPSVRTMPDTHYLDAWHMDAHGAWVEANAIGDLLRAWLQQHPL